MNILGLLEGPGWKILLFLLPLFLFQCSERERDNPFDPIGNRPSPVTLTLSPEKNSVHLSWEISDITDYKGFRIYRAVDKQTDFVLFAELPANVFSFTDTTVEFYHWYYYQVTVVGRSVESSPSNLEKVYPGPGVNWVLSRYGFWVKKLSYDLLHTLEHYNTRFPPTSWDVHLADSTIWLAYAEYRNISRLNLQLGYEDFYLYEELGRPVDVQIDTLNQKIYVLDNGRDRIWVLQDTTISAWIDLSEGDYFKLAFHPATLQLLALAREKLVIASATGLIQLQEVAFADTATARDMAIMNHHLWILLTETHHRSRILSNPTLPFLQWDTLSITGTFYRFLPDKAGPYFYLAEQISDGQQNLVKLSGTGTRLQEWSGFTFIEQIQMNPYDGSLLVVDRLGDAIYLYDRNGKLINKSRELYDAIRIFVE